MPSIVNNVTTFAEASVRVSGQPTLEVTRRLFQGRDRDTKVDVDLAYKLMRVNSVLGKAKLTELEFQAIFPGWVILTVTGL